jgi:hypothetical protein
VNTYALSLVALLAAWLVVCAVAWRILGDEP